MTTITRDWLEAPVHELNDTTLMKLKLELMRKVTELHQEISLREVARGNQ